jgi:hypothetical protein
MTLCGFVCKKQRIPGTDFCTIHNPNYKITDPICSVCLDQPNDPVKLNVCQHVFCKECISKCIITKPTCPLCRDEVSMIDFSKGLYYVHGAQVLSNFIDQCEKKITVPKSYRPKQMESTANTFLFRFQA